MNKREQQLLNYLRNNNIKPTAAEMKKAINTNSTSTLYQILDSLEEKDLIRRNGKWRGIKLREVSEDQINETEWIRIPLLGTVAAGHPIEAILEDETISVPTSMIKKDKEYFGLRVRGDSMIDKHIEDGDRIALEKTSTAEEGDTVVALIDNENATIKTFRRSGDKVLLEPANKDFETLEVSADRVTIQGKLVGLIRNYQHNQ